MLVFDNSTYITFLSRRKHCYFETKDVVLWVLRHQSQVAEEVSLLC
jgi:hypothetical protein